MATRTVSPKPRKTPAARKRPARAAIVKPAAEALRDKEGFDAIDKLKAVKADLTAVQRRLRNVDASELDDAARQQRADQLSEVDLAIGVVRDALLNGIADKFEAELPKLSDATAELAKSLERLKKTAEVIEAVAAAIGVVQRIVTLGS